MDFPVSPSNDQTTYNYYSEEVLRGDVVHSGHVYRRGHLSDSSHPRTRQVLLRHSPCLRPTTRPARSVRQNVAP